MALKRNNGPKTLVFDIETAPLEVFAWGVNDQVVGLSQVIKDRSVLSFAAKWLKADKVVFASTGGQKDVRDDRRVVGQLRDLLDEADIVVTQNGKAFDEPIIKGRLAVHGIDPPSPYMHHDTCLMARRMGFPSSKLEYLTKTLCPEMAKDQHNTFPGQSLWTECLKNNRKAWKVMEAYNKQDVRGTEGVFNRLAPYSNISRLDVFDDSLSWVCGACGGTKWRRNGHQYRANGVFRRYRCCGCGAPAQETGAANNLLSKEKRKSMRGAA